MKTKIIICKIIIFFKNLIKRQINFANNDETKKKCICNACGVMVSGNEVKEVTKNKIK